MHRLDSMPKVHTSYPIWPPCDKGELRRNPEVKKISSDFESNSFANLARISDENMMEEDLEDVEESLTHKLTSRVDAT